MAACHMVDVSVTWRVCQTRAGLCSAQAIGIDYVLVNGVVLLERVMHLHLDDATLAVWNAKSTPVMAVMTSVPGPLLDPHDRSGAWPGGDYGWLVGLSETAPSAAKPHETAPVAKPTKR